MQVVSNSEGNMKYSMLNLATALAVFATKVADRLTVIAARSAEAADVLSIKADTAALGLKTQIVQAKVDKALASQVAAYSAYQRCRSNFQDKTWKALRDLAALEAKHSRAKGAVSSC